MKTRILFACLLTCTLVSITFSSCGDDDKEILQPTAEKEEETPPDNSTGEENTEDPIHDLPYLDGSWDNEESDGIFVEGFYFEQKTHTVTYQWIFDNNRTVSREIMAEGTYRCIDENHINLSFSYISVECDDGSKELNGFYDGGVWAEQVLIEQISQSKLILYFNGRRITLIKDEESEGNEDKNNTQDIKVTTLSDANVGWANANVKGSISGVSENVEVGFIYGKEKNLSSSSGKVIKTTSRSNFQLTIKDLIDDETYYYRAYAYVNNKYYYGEIRSIKTPEFTYKIDGKPYKMKRVEGGSMPAFAIMEVEIPPSCNFQISTASETRPDKNGDGIVIKAELHSFLMDIQSASGLPLRIPTLQEWLYAASGGQRSKDYTYSGSNSIESVAWYQSNSNGKPHAIASKTPNELGIYDMSGNYGEFCFTDEEDSQQSGILTGGSWSMNKSVICGGNWNSESSDCTVSSYYNKPNSGKIGNSKITWYNSFDASFITVRLVYSRE